MIAFQRHILRLLDLVHALQDCQPVADTGDAHGLEIIVQKCHEGFADDFVLCVEIMSVRKKSRTRRTSPQTYEEVGILIQADGADEVGALVGSPLRDDGLW